MTKTLEKVVRRQPGVAWLWLVNLFFIVLSMNFCLRGMSAKALKFIWVGINGNLKNIETAKSLLPSSLDFVSTFYFAILLIVVIASLGVLAFVKSNRLIHLLFNFVIFLFILILTIALEPLPWVELLGV